MFKNFLSGIGSVLDVFPSSEVDKHILSKTDEELMRENFELVGHSMYSAIEGYRKDVEEEQKSECSASQH